MIPFIDITRFENGFLEEWEAHVSKISKNADFIGGEHVAVIEQSLSHRCEVKQTVTCANGTDAIQLALRALGVGEGDVVLVTNMSFWATFEAVVNVGANPATVDISIEDGGIDISAFEQAIDQLKPKAAVIAQLYGWGTSKLKELRDLSAQKGVLLIEDGAQSFGVKWCGSSIYSGALVSTTSFYPAKVLGAAGDAGALFTNDPDLAKKIRCLANHGRSTHYKHSDVGWNSRLDNLQAAYLELGIKHLDARLSSRRQSANFYRNQILKNAVTIMEPPVGYEENGYCNVMLIHDKRTKDLIETELKKQNIGFGNIYPRSISMQPAAQKYSKGHFGKNHAEKFSNQVINLPLFPYMKRSELERVTDTVNKLLK